MAVQSLVLTASLTNFPLFAARRGNPKFRAACKKIWQRDDYTCRYCGFHAKDYQEVVNLDQNYRNNKFDNLVTACVFCTQCMFLESVGDNGYGGGSLIYMTEITQNDINSLSHVLFCAMANNSQYRDTAQSIYQTLKIRSNIIEKEFGDGMSDPANFAQVLLDYQANHKDNKKVKKMLRHLRLLPARGRFSRQIEHWAKNAKET